MKLESLLKPQRIAVIGASENRGKVGHEIFANLVKGGFEGELVPVNYKADTILGYKCYPSIRDYPQEVDLCVISIPTPLVMEAVKDSLAAGARSICVITAGFKETGPEGAAVEEKLASLCDAAGVRLLGPNCLGLINSHHKMNATFGSHMPQEGGISVISQSGALCTAILDWAAGRHMGLAKMISMGNKADLSETDFLKALGDDPETRVIAGYLESINDGNSFMKAAQATAQKKPVAILKVGVTDAGGKAASSHTGSLAGADIAYGAAFKRSGIIRADSFEELFDYATALDMQPLPRGRRVAIITNAGGPGIMAADAAELAGLVVQPLEGAAAAALREKLPVAASVANPIDVLGDADPQRYVDAVEAAQNDDSVDAVIVILTPQAMTNPTETARAIIACAGGRKPVLASFMGGADVMPGRDELVAAGLPDYPSPERAVAALKAMVTYSEWLQRPPRVLTRFAVNRRRVERIVKRNQRAGTLQLSELESKEILTAYGFQVPIGRLATTTAEALAAAERTGYPVAMKIASPDIIHKSDIGGVKLNLNTPEEIVDAFDLMMLRIPRQVPEAVINGVYLEAMCRAGREVILGMTRDPQFGPMLMFGLGGIFVEVMKDVTFHIAPITAAEAMQMLESTKSFALLKGVRGQSSVDLDAIAIALQRISQLVTDFPQIVEMDINPYMVGEVGNDSVAADAVIKLRADEVKS